MRYGLVVVTLLAMAGEVEAQSIFQRVDSMLTIRYRKVLRRAPVEGIKRF